MQDQIIVIGEWDDPACRTLKLQNFVADGISFIPLFSDEAAFERQVKGSGFEDDGLAIDCNLLLSMLHGDELLILNPNDPDPVKMTKADLADRLDRGLGVTAR